MSILRSATREDAAALLSIYGQYMSTPITFECELPSVAEFSQRIEETLREYPYLVAEEHGKICGYAYAHRFHPREAYQWGAELSIYLAREATRHGLGRTLYEELLARLKRQGVRTAYGCVTVPNAASEHLHETLGFRLVGVFRNAGFKDGAWHDVAWFEKPLGAYDAPASAPIPYPRLAATSGHP